MRDGPRAAQHGMNACEEFFEVERLGDVVVGPELQAADLVALLSHRRQQDDGHLRLPPPQLAQFESRSTGQIHVEQHEIG